MNTKRDAVYHFHRKAELWTYVGLLSAGIALGEMIYILWLHIQLANCYAS